MFEDMFKDLFIESSIEDDAVVEGVTLTTDEDGFVSAECEIDEANILDCDPFEFITEAMYQNVINANNISMAVLADNYKYLKENGVELVAEAEAAEKQKGKKREAIGKFFHNIREKIQKFFDTVLAKMVELQAKFKVLTKKAQEKVKSGMGKLSGDVTVSNYVPADVVSWANMNMSIAADPASAKPVKGFGEIKQIAPEFDKELDTIKKYGSYIRDVKTFRNECLKRINDIEKDELKDKNVLADLSKGEKKEAIKTSYASRSNQVVSIAKEGVSLIMRRVNEAAKVINAACKAGKEAKKEEKKAVNASASFIESVEMI